MRTPRIVLPLLLSAAVAGWPGSTYAQTQSLFDGESLRGWILEGATARVDSGVLRMGDGLGWARTERPFANFILRFESRLRGRDARAGVFVRTWPTFDDTTRKPNNGYRVVVADRERDGITPGQVVGHGTGGKVAFVNPAPPATPAADSDPEWHLYEVECNGSRVRVRIDGTEVYAVESVEWPQGYVALYVESGDAEFRKIEIDRIPSPRPAVDRPAGVLSAKGADSLPRPTRQVKPEYTAQAMQARIQGAVLLECIVDVSGRCTELQVLQSLDPKFGLDKQAIEAAEQWRFSPATRSGKPVPVIVTIELTFTLK